MSRTDESMSAALALHAEAMPRRRPKAVPPDRDEAEHVDVRGIAATPVLVAWAEVGTFRGCVLVTIAIVCARILRRVIARLQTEVAP